MSKNTALITGTALPEVHIKKIESLGYSCINGSVAALASLGTPTDECNRELNQDEIKRLIPNVVTYIYGGLEAASAEVLNSAKKLNHIAFLGTGWNDDGCIDKAAAIANNIIVTNTPHANAASVAEITMGLMLSLERCIPHMNAETKVGKWIPIKRRDLAQKTLGIIGLGHIGSKVARHASLGFGMKVIYSGPHRKPALEQELNLEYKSLDELLINSDFISIHSPAVSTEGLLTADKLNLLKQDAILLNLSAPAVVDAAWLINALETGRIRGAAFDGIYKKPETLMKRFLNLPNDRFIVLPRSAWLTEDSYERMGDMAIESIKDVIKNNTTISNRVI